MSLRDVRHEARLLDEVKEVRVREFVELILKVRMMMERQLFEC
jgi:hypothetical protein